MTAPEGWGRNSSRATTDSRGISGSCLRPPGFSRLSPLPSGVSAGDHRASFNGPPKGDCCVMTGHVLTVPEISAAITVATPRTRTMLARFRQRSSLLRLRALVRMIAILRRSDGGRIQTQHNMPIHLDIGFAPTAVSHARFSPMPRSLTGRLHASQLRNVATASIWWTTDRCQAVLQASFRPTALDDSACAGRGDCTPTFGYKIPGSELA